ncbi:DUF4136 domain-containing protein [Halopseudomonas sp.]|uniref:DUF4136 domain-containing protein n=1 Tax=Halopseudomonas sp. TaxID=2901191 RepID=UPI003565B5AE
MLSLRWSTLHCLPQTMRNALLVGCALLLAACQTTQVERDYDTSRDFTHYRTWAWAEPAITYTPQDDPRVGSDLTSQRIREAVRGELEARGLRQAGDTGSADLLFQVDVISEKEQDQVTTTWGGSFGYWGWGWGGGPAYAQSRSVEYQMLTLQIDMRDVEDGQLVWRGSDERQLWDASRAPAEREQQIRDMVSRILSAYPPS